MVVTSYGRNKNLDDEIINTKRTTIVAPAIAVRLLIRNQFVFAVFLATDFVNEGNSSDEMVVACGLSHILLRVYSGVFLLSFPMHMPDTVLYI